MKAAWLSCFATTTVRSTPAPSRASWSGRATPRRHIRRPRRISESPWRWKMIADNLLKCNAHFRASAAVWKVEGKDPRQTRVRIASRFTRIAFQMVAGGQLFQHPSRPQRGYVLDKLIEFHHERETAADQILRDLQRACGQIPASQHVSEAAPLQRRLQKAQRWRRKGPVPISKIMLSVLAKLGVGALPSAASEAQDPDGPRSGRGVDNVS